MSPSIRSAIQTVPVDATPASVGKIARPSEVLGIYRERVYKVETTAAANAQMA